MGRMLGAFDSEDLDRPDLNKCPDCGCYFVQDDCPLCGKRCPDEMRAGNRKAVKKTKKKKGSSGRVTFVEWYHSWLFIILMMIFMPIVGIVLLVTSPHKRSLKIALIAVCVVIAVLPGLLVGVFDFLANTFEKPVDTSLSREEYIGACESVDAEDFYRRSDAYAGKFVSLDLTIREKFVDGDASKYDKYPVHYICTDMNGKNIEIIIRDCRSDEMQNFIVGDMIRIYGEGVGNYEVYDEDYDVRSAPAIFVAYASIIG